MSNAYDIAYTQSIQDPDAFWGKVAEDCHWYKKWDKVLDDSRKPFYRWFTGGELNTCYNALDLHVDRGRGGQTALVYDSPVTQTVRTFTYLQLRDEVARFAGALAARGVTKGDRVIIYMPMIPEALVAILACARLGAVHSVVFGGFAPPELAVRINDAKPKLIVSASCGIEINRVIPYKPLLDAAIDIASSKPDALHHRPAADAEGRDEARARPRLERGPGEGQAPRLRAGEGHRPPVHPVHLRHHRRPQGRGARQRRPRGRPEVDHEGHLQRGRGRRLLGGFGRGLGGGAFLHRVRAPLQRLHHHPLRGQAGGHAGCGCVLAGDLAA